MTSTQLVQSLPSILFGATVGLPTHSTTSTLSPTASSSSPPAPGGGSPNSHLLFFVALGFGVVFINLWIVVGVKYCFRYNARNRARANGTDDENVDLQALPRPHRRRREKKLMTMDEVNKRFPLIKYKAWRTTREQEGLPAAGGITAPPSRAASIKNVDTHETNDTPGPDIPAVPESAVVPYVDVTLTAQEPALAQTEPKGHLEGPTDSSTAKHLSDGSMDEDQKLLGLKDKLASDGILEADNHSHHRTPSTDDDQIYTAVPPEMLATPGDSCAICIDNLEDNEDVRGLTCGHAFHAHCLDPWLTSRHACCPLCKADYYIPKPHSEGDAAPEATAVREPGNRSQLTAPVNTSRRVAEPGPEAGHGLTPARHQRRRTSVNADSWLAYEARRRSTVVRSPPSNSTPRRGFLAGWRNRDSPPTAAETTPAQVEAGAVPAPAPAPTTSTTNAR